MRNRFQMLLLMVLVISNITSAQNSKGINVRDYGAKGDGATDDAVAINKAWAAALKSNVPLYVPVGTYIVSSNVIVPPLGNNSQVVLQGDGAKSILKRKNGSVISNVSMIIFDASKASGNVDIVIKNISFDDNGNNQPQPKHPYDLEHASTIRFGGGNNKFIYNTYSVSNVTFSNPIADNVWVNALGNQFTAVNVTGKNRTRTRSDIEFSLMPKQVNISNCNLNSLESEPIPNAPQNFSCNFKISNVVLNQTLDLSGINNKYPVVLDARQVVVKGQTYLANMMGGFTDCTLRDMGRLIRDNLAFKNCKIIFVVKENTDSVKPVKIDYNSDKDPYTKFTSNTFTNCQFPIESTLKEISGTMFVSFSAQKTLDVVTTFDNCVFDTRSDCNIENYRNGRYIVKDCTLGVNPHSDKPCVNLKLTNYLYKSKVDLGNNKITTGNYKNF